MLNLRSARFLLPLAAILLLQPSRARAQAAAPPASDADEQAFNKQEKRWIKEVEADLIEEKFDDLERMADEYRRDRTRLPGGEWKLRVFYGALDAPQLTDQDSVDHIAHLEHWMLKRPESITPRIALSTSLHRWAWVARGNGMANTVTAEGWELFNKRIAESQMVLTNSANLHAMCPQWYSEMMTVGLAQSWDEARIRDTFERGIQLEPDYYYLYKQYANYLLPKWDGKPGEAAAFAKRSADKRGGDAGDMLYFQIASTLISRSNGKFPVEQMDWKRIQRGAEVLQTQFGATRKTANVLAYMAYKYKDASTARKLFASIGDDWARGVWRDKQYYDRARDWSNGHNF
ncbi:protein of unknown function [Granulicella rosea]|uniref:DUF4034 domain-containing protein n=1 Tax=Granulicella rosea TaxID=474952 RepID=A0A239JNB0_9BACT|nr:DUF4034 domain-containing protein [Granulicella rosea]SNT07305.1 protein of unknown function [Granulicella rosea]